MKKPHDTSDDDTYSVADEENCNESDNRFKRRGVTSESLESVTRTSNTTDASLGATLGATFGDGMEILYTFSDPDKGY